MSINAIATTDTFRAWFNKTNEIANVINSLVMTAGATAYGAFALGAAANTSFGLGTLFTVNSSAVGLGANTTFNANVVITSNVGSVNISANTFTVQPASGTLFNTALTINAAATINANVTMTGVFALVGNATVNGTVTVANGSLGVRQILFNSANAVTANTLSDVQYDNFAPTGLAECQILDLTPNVDTVLTGLAAPTSLVGARLLYVQNLSGSYKVTFASSNTSSSANNQFKLPNDTAFDLLPGTSVALVWESTNHNWRTLGGGAAGSSNTSSLGNTVITGTLSVSGNTTLSAKLAVTGNTTIGGALGVTGNTTLGNVNFTGTNTYFSTDVTTTGTLTTGANTSLAGAVLVAETTNKGVTFANTVTANSASQSFIRNLKANALAVDTSATIAALVVTGNTTVATLNVTTLNLSTNASFAGLTVTGSANSANVNVTGTVATAALSTSGLASLASLSVAGNSALATLATTGLATLASANVTGTAMFSGKVVLPVGSNLWA